MIHFSLVYRNGEREGQRVTIDAAEFVIGRHPKANLPLESRSVSRRHCVIVQREGMVIAIDLGSRNPTLINGQPLTPNKPKRLQDRDKVQIGRIKFRFRVKETLDAVSDQPSWSAPLHESPSGPLLDELSEIATQFGVGSIDAAGDVDDKPTTKTIGLIRNLFPSPKSPEEAERGLQELEAQTRGLAETVSDMDTVVDSVIQGPAADQDENLEAKETEGDSEGDLEGDLEAGDEKGPKKLPEHLRPKGPANSQNAAEIALRNMFNRR